METLSKILLFAMAFLAFCVIVIMMIGAWPWFPKNQKPEAPGVSLLYAPDEIDARNAKIFQRRLALFFVCLTIGGLILGAEFKHRETPTSQTLYWLGLILFMVCPVFIMVSLDDKAVSVLFKNKQLRWELAFIAITGIAELVFMSKDENEHILLRSYKGAALFLIWVGLLLFMFYRIVKKLEDD